MGNSEKVVLGILCGIATGVVLGVLVAPDKGSATRLKIVKAREDYFNLIEKKFNSLVDHFSKTDSNGKEVILDSSNDKANKKDVKVDNYPNVVN